jgi:hypothetical protein
MDNNKLVITPKTKILQLLEAYPHLEDLLIGYVPAFKKLKNPVLRKTVGKITTLQQVASIGNVKVGDLINFLRQEVGQDLLTDSIDTVYNQVQPAWFNAGIINQEFDVREMLKSGEQPVNQVVADLNKMSGGTIYKLIAPFLPAPLIDKATSLNISHWVVKEADESFLIYFYKGKI